MSDDIKLPADAHMDKDGRIWLRPYADIQPTRPVRVFEIGPDTLTNPERHFNEVYAALRGLEYWEQVYRRAHDVDGPDNVNTDRAWTKMRMAGDNARALLDRIRDEANDSIDS